MTTIAYRSGIMASDSRAYTGGREPMGEKLKIRRLPGGTLIGCSSTIPGAGERVIDWFVGGADTEAALPSNFVLLAVHSDGSVLYGTDTAHLSGPIKAPFYAIGSGAEYAMGAMSMGATAVEAVRVACGLDVWSALPINCLKHDGRKTQWQVAA